MCKELPTVEYARDPGKVLWDTTVVIFALHNSGKRVRLGNLAMLPKDTYKRFILSINVSVGKLSPLGVPYLFLSMSPTRCYTVFQKDHKP